MHNISWIFFTFCPNLASEYISSQSFSYYVIWSSIPNSHVVCYNVVPFYIYFIILQKSRPWLWHLFYLYTSSLFSTPSMYPSPIHNLFFNYSNLISHLNSSLCSTPAQLSFTKSCLYPWIVGSCLHFFLIEAEKFFHTSSSIRL